MNKQITKTTVTKEYDEDGRVVKETSVTESETQMHTVTTTPVYPVGPYPYYGWRPNITSGTTSVIYNGSVSDSDSSAQIGAIAARHIAQAGV